MGVLLSSAVKEMQLERLVNHINYRLNDSAKLGIFKEPHLDEGILSRERLERLESDLKAEFEKVFVERCTILVADRCVMTIFYQYCMHNKLIMCVIQISHFLFHAFSSGLLLLDYRKVFKL